MIHNFITVYRIKDNFNSYFSLIYNYCSAIHLTDGLDKVFVDNYHKDHFIFAQYFGSTSGLLRYYPAYYWEDVNNQVCVVNCMHSPVPTLFPSSYP